MTRTVHIHLGPHKTGSTAIQARIHGDFGGVLKKKGIAVVPARLTRELGKYLAKGKTEAARAEISRIREFCQRAEGDCLLSSEDFSGDLPGRSNDHKVYPRLVDNMLLLRNEMSDLNVVFYFFCRRPDNWLRSAYVQIAKHRHRFTSIESYLSFLDINGLWDDVLKDARNIFGPNFIEIDYQEGPDFNSLAALIGRVIEIDSKIEPLLASPRVNESPTNEVVLLLEIINSSGASSHAKRVARQRLLSSPSVPQVKEIEPISHQVKVSDGPAWPPLKHKPAWISDDFASLWERVEVRVSNQDQPDLLSGYYREIEKLKFNIVTASDEFPTGGREKMEGQLEILKYRFRGQPETCVALALAISYLRRSTQHTELARRLFKELWDLEHEILLATLPTRWLISSFQTFMEHGENDSQRLVGAASFFFANMLKGYEAERSLEGLQPDAVYPHAAPVTKNGVNGLDRFKLGGTDLFLNLTSLFLEVLSRDEVAGRVSQEFLLRLKYGATVFSRMDRSRIAHGIDVKQFSNCWSFFEKPE